MFFLLLFGFLAASAQANQVNCGQALHDAKVPYCIAIEEKPIRGCGKDILVPKGSPWTGKAQTLEAYKMKASSAAACLKSYSNYFPKDGCCRREIARSKKAPAKAKTPALTNNKPQSRKK